MCSPEVAKVVSERIAREGRPQFSRRNFLRLGGVAAAGLAVASSVPVRVTRAQEVTQLVDLTHVFGTNVPTYVPTDTPSRETTVTVKDNGFYIQRWSFGEHTSTHVDIPAHFVEGAETVDQYAPELLVSPAVVIDISAKAAEDPNAMLTADDIAAWESANGEIPAGALVCMYSGWESKWNDVAAFRGDAGDGKLNFPGFGPDAAQFLLEERDIHGIAVDTLSIDPGNSTTFDVHVAVLSAGKYGVEGVANLSQLIGKQATVVVGVPRWEEGSGGPCRMLAMVS
ncbi:MAG: cyclase family protein [Chloroflexi bacterium]|nr:cyclase family protein [Chloroflexota bacterium]